MIRVRTASRLHFGLLSLPAGGHWENWQGEAVVPARRFGGVGLMVREPGIELALRPAAAWSAEGPLAERALELARQFAAAVPAEQAPPQHVIVTRAARAHSGLGTGTQLGLAVARALATAWQLGPLDAIELARRVGRGQRSALGVHGFARGGFLVDGGKSERATLAPLIARVDFPEPWRLVLGIPLDLAGTHGADESEAFRRLGSRGAPIELTERLCRLVLLGLLPALAERDLPAFGECLYDFNARAGQLFAAEQGGTYSTARAAELVAFVRRQGVRGTGQSSWGPTVFAVTEDQDRAEHLAARLRERFGETSEVLISAAYNGGAEVVDERFAPGSTLPGAQR
jgi:beta-RFAP synthase